VPGRLEGEWADRPELDFDKLIFVKRKTYTANHYYTKHIKTRNSIVNEEEMLLDIYFLRELIEKYKSHCMAKETKNHYITFRDEVKGKLNFDVPDKSTKSYVRGRLKHLSKEKEEIAKVLDKIQSLG